MYTALADRSVRREGWLLLLCQHPRQRHTRYTWSLQEVPAAQLELHAYQSSLSCLCSWLAATLLARLLFSRVATAWCNQRVAKAADPAHRDGLKLREELFVTLTGAIQMAAALFVLARHNGGCTFASASAEMCLRGWPNHDVDASAQR